MRFCDSSGLAISCNTYTGLASSWDISFWRVYMQYG